jgi:uncharacterized protein YndB with AHSA1/START domain
MDTKQLQLTQVPITKVGMLIRKPAAAVFQAFVDPAITTRFWFTKSTGKVVTGATLRWDWEMYGVHTEVSVKEVKDNERIVISWGESDKPRTVDLQFTSYGDSTYLQITESGFVGTGDELVSHVTNATGGFTSVLCALKALLEHQIVLTVVADHLPPKRV